MLPARDLPNGNELPKCANPCRLILEERLIMTRFEGSVGPRQCQAFARIPAFVTSTRAQARRQFFVSQGRVANRYRESMFLDLASVLHGWRTLFGHATNFHAADGQCPSRFWLAKSFGFSRQAFPCSPLCCWSRGCYFRMEPLTK